MRRQVDRVQDDLAVASVTTRKRTGAAEVGAAERIDASVAEARDARRKVLIREGAGEGTTGGAPEAGRSIAKLTARLSCGLFRKSGRDVLKA